MRATVIHQPLVIVLDDIHWADIPSLQLLRFLAIDARNAPVLIIATYRDSELGPRHPASSIIADLSREPHCIRLSLHGLTKQQVARFMAMIAGTPQPASLVDVIFEETEGNPFFVTEVVRLLAEENSLGASEVGRAACRFRRVSVGRSGDASIGLHPTVAAFWLSPRLPGVTWTCVCWRRSSAYPRWSCWTCSTKQREHSSSFREMGQ